MRGKTVFLTGATGFIGSFLLQGLLKNGYRLKVLVRDGQASAEDRVERLLRRFFKEESDYRKAKSSVETVRGDVTLDDLGISSSVIERLAAEVDIVFNNAASTKFDADRENSNLQNVTGTENMLKFTLRTADANFHHMSSAYICGRESGVFREDDLDVGQAFKNTYEESKFGAERLIHEYRRSCGLRATVYRPSIVVGDSRTGEALSFTGLYGFIQTLHLLMDIFRRDLERGGKRALKAGVTYRDNVLHIPLRILASGAKTLNLVPVDYVVDAVVRIMNVPRAHNKTYHLVNPAPPTIGHISTAICSLFHLSGIHVLGSESFAGTPMSPWEDLFAASIRSFSPYLQGEEPVFSQENTREILQGTGIQCPPVDEVLIERLVSYYYWATHQDLK